MSLLLVALLAGLGVSPAQGGDTSSSQAACSQASAVPPRSPAELRAAAHEVLRRWAHPTQATAKQAARELLSLYNEVLRQPQMAQESRQELLATLRGRLRNLAQQIAADDAKLPKVAPAGVVAAQPDRPPLAADAPPAGANAAGRVLAQIAPRGAAGMGGQPGVPGVGGNPNSPSPDDGQDLVDLIQKTIAPQSWDINGGLGSIMYWPGNQVIVVRQTEEVHDALGDLIDQLQRAAH